MKSFTFWNYTRVVFGLEAEKELPSYIPLLGRKVLLHYGGGSIKKIGLYDVVVKALKDAGVEWVELGGVKPNPRLSLVHEGIELCRKEGVTGILAVGGGSVIDSAKAIAAGVKYEGDVWDFYAGKAQPKETLPVGVVLTIPAAGSETSGSSVVTKEDGQLKRGITYDILRPQFAILNPKWTLSLPWYQTACGISDMLAHVMERYFTTVPHVELTDRMAEGVMRTIIHQAYRLKEDPNDINARSEIMWAGTVAHNDLLGTGREGDWTSHGIEHEISGIYDLAHGAGLSIVFPAWLKYVLPKRTEKIAQFAHRVFGMDYYFDNPEETAREGVRRLEQFYRDMGLPVRLKEAGIDGSRIREMAEKTRDGKRPVGSFVQLSTDDIEKILTLALE
ncbi:iron-containing alcohol dehydrogenase [Spirochaeta thermophila]|uniref:Uncharacterized protein n=1 Tax=Winmispira thermophila (strain ATCC 49972 / DSM 6192 / RI 19.B1) TaxID=665571 RepID=E0RTS2_WINT6|nr:iron-containing alcohol dehydrogenase [Spirochaeta thermophila]ADN02447.1 hypothetical protein STHERM_c15070 [Spirochaeta thermophila DSM 6192]